MSFAWNMDFFKKAVIYIITAILAVFPSLQPKPVVLPPGENSPYLTQTDVVTDDQRKDPLTAGFDRNASKGFIIPGLNEGLIPQGICYSEENDLYLINGYYENEDAASRVAVVGADGGFIKSASIVRKSGKASAGHFGGIAVFKDNVYITFSKNILVLSLADILACKDGGAVKTKEEFTTYINSSFCEVCDGVLWVGSFIENDRDVLNASDIKYTSKMGERFYSRCDAYELDENAPFGFKAEDINGKNVIPSKSVAIPNEVQGLTVLHDETIVMSSSYGRDQHSFVYVYRNVFSRGAGGTINVDGRDIPLYYCLRSLRSGNYTAPNMLEEMTLLPDGRLCFITESGSNKYRFGKGIRPLDNVILWNV